MSLLRQLWLTVLAAMLVALGACLTASVLSARDYLEQQLHAQASDSAAALALSMSQQGADRATAELLISAMFDSGHFESIVYRDVAGQTLVERRYAGKIEGVPAWFARWVQLRAGAGEALVNHGWQQGGTVRVVANGRFAHASLWQGSVRIAAWLAAAGLLWGMAVSLLMRWVRRPLAVMTAQAEAIGERRFTPVEEPPVKELQAIARALNTLGARVEAMFGEQSSRIEQLRSEANRDPVTGIANRSFFMGRMRGALHDERMPAVGSVVLARVSDLAGLNRQVGHAGVDERLRALAACFAGLIRDRNDAMLARLNGSDFALLLPGMDEEAASLLAQACLTMMEDLDLPEADTRRPAGLAGFVAHTAYAHGEFEGTVLARADAALMNAEAGIEVPAQAPLSASSRSMQDWRRLIDEALAHQAFELVTYPVLAADGSLLHAEAMLRLVHDAEQLTAGQFMPAALRLARMAALDAMTVRLALRHLRLHAGELAVNLSAQSIAQAGFRQNLSEILAAHRQETSRLWVEIGEQGLSETLGELTELHEALRPYGCRVGIEHFGRHLAAIPRLTRIRVDYLKLDGSFVAGIDQHLGNQRFVKAVVDVARSLGAAVIAERVHNEAEWDSLRSLGVGGFTGPAVTAAAKRGRSE